MAFDVVVIEKAEFALWLQQQGREALEPVTQLAVQGRDQFIANGCAACHTIRGTPARGVIGPELTHVGSRLTLGAGTLPNEIERAHDWIARVDRIKPGVLMPSFGMLADEDLRALAVYLDGLK
jgi:cytochrome c oxidase subunit 2